MGTPEKQHSSGNGRAQSSNRPLGILTGGCWTRAVPLRGSSFLADYKCAGISQAYLNTGMDTERSSTVRKLHHQPMIVCSGLRDEASFVEIAGIEQQK